MKKFSYIILLFFSLIVISCQELKSDSTWTGNSLNSFSLLAGGQVYEIKFDANSTAKVLLPVGAQMPSHVTVKGFSKSFGMKGLELGQKIPVDKEGNAKFVISSEDTKSVKNYTINLHLSYYYVEFNTVGGSSVERQIVRRDRLAQRPASPAKQDFVFVDWYKEAQYVNRFRFNLERINENITLYAKWGVMVSFEGVNLASSAPVETVLNPGEVFVKPTADPVYIEHFFDGWYQDNHHTVPFDFSRPININTTIYVKWIVRNYKFQNGIILGLKAINSGDTEVTIVKDIDGQDVTTIGPSAFANTSIRNIIIRKVTSIEQNAFLNCTDLEAVNLPAGLTDIKDNAFKGCTGAVILLKSNTPPNIATDVFGSPGSTVSAIRVPEAAKNAYKNHPDWSAYNTIISGY